jgi:hypothetical protein
MFIKKYNARNVNGIINEYIDELLTVSVMNIGMNAEIKAQNKEACCDLVIFFAIR